MGTLFLNQQHYSFDAVRIHGKGLLNESEHYFSASFELAQQWLSGSTSFTFHTSGSTGTPKEIVLQRGQLEASARGTIEALGLTSDDHFWVCMNTQFIGGAMLLIRGLILDATITLQEPSGNPLQFIEKNHPYTFASFAPVQLFPLLLNEYAEREKLSLFRFILLGGAPVDSILEQTLSRLNTTVYHTYGMTETVSHIALRQIGNQSFYTTLSNVAIQTDDRGCLKICGPSTQNQWVQTNDAVTLLSETTFELHGRVDEVINSGGIKLWPAKIETAIQERLNPHITNVFVAALPHPKLGQQAVTIVESTADSAFLQQLLAPPFAELGKYEVPKDFYVVQHFIYTPTGKINKPETLKMIGLQQKRG